MSLRARVVGLIGFMLLLSMAGGLWLAGLEARRAVHDELLAALVGGRQTIASSFEDIPRSDHPDRDLRQLVSTFDGNRHVSAVWVDATGRVRWTSRRDPANDPAPEWFARLLTPGLASSRTNVPPHVGSGGVLILQPSAQLDIAADWAEFSSAGALLCVAVLLGLVAAFWAIGQALQPLDDLSAAFRAITRGDYRSRVRERGPPELKHLERGFNDMAEKLAASHERNRVLEAQLVTIQDEERAELARELHDEIGPHLFTVNVDAQVIGHEAARGGTSEIAERVRSIHESVSHMQRLVREILVRLRPVQVTELGLHTALTELVDFWRGRRPDIAFSLAQSNDETRLSEPAKEAAYRTVQEALSNAVRHARPTQVGIDVRDEGGGTLLVRVRNDGAGGGATPSTGGLGLLGMQERAAALTGEVRIERAGSTWTVDLSLPLQPPRSAASEAAE